MKKRIFAGLLSAAMALSLLVSPASAAGGMENFVPVQNYIPGMFRDVPPNEWYAENVADAYELGLMKGRDSSLFAPSGNVTLTEAVVMATRIHSLYYRGHTDFDQSGELWYAEYYAYAQEMGIVSAGTEHEQRSATRAEFAEILSRALPREELPVLNDLPEGAIPDVSTGANYADEVYLLYRAGILTGSDEALRFLPDSSISRAEAAAILSRLVFPAQRKLLAFAPDPAPEEFRDSVFIEQGSRGGCVVACAAMMISNYRLAHGQMAVSYYDVESTNGGVYFQWGTFEHYGLEGQQILAQGESLSSGAKLEKLLRTLEQNPYGVLTHFQSSSGSHAVLVTGYENGHLIVNDPISTSYGGAGLRLQDCLYLTESITGPVNQAKMLDYCDYMIAVS